MADIHHPCDCSELEEYITRSHVCVQEVLFLVLDERPYCAVADAFWLC